MGLVSDVQTYLQSQGIVDGSTDWPSVRRAMYDPPKGQDNEQLVGITEDGGFAPEVLTADGSMGDSALRNPMVQVRVRGNPWDGDSAEAKMTEITAALHGVLNAVIGSTRYMRIKAETEEIFLGFDERGRPDFTTSYRATLPVS